MFILLGRFLAVVGNGFGEALVGQLDALHQVHGLQAGDRLFHDLLQVSWLGSQGTVPRLSAPFCTPLAWCLWYYSCAQSVRCWIFLSKAFDEPELAAKLLPIRYAAGGIDVLMLVC